MTIFQQFRLWARRAPIAERASAALGAAVALAAIAFLLVPAGSSNNNLAVGAGLNGGSSGAGQQATAGGQPGTGGQPGSQAAGGSGGAPGPGTGAGAGGNPASGAGTQTAAGGGSGGSGGAGGGTSPAGAGPAAPGGAGTGTTPTGAPSGGRGCVSPPGTDAGVTSSDIKIAVILIQILGPAANSTFGVPPPATQQADMQAVIDSINASGGAACRKLVPTYYTGDPADTSNLQQTCLSIASAQPFFVVDLGAYYTYPELATCYPKAGIGYIDTGGLTASQQQELYPYDFGLFLDESLYHDTVVGLQQRGFFAASNGFKKLGILYTDCLPQLEGEVVGWLREAGVPSSAVVGHDVGCPASFDTPSDLESAILTFQQEGVTNVTVVHDTEDFSIFTTIASQQHFQPKYGLADEGLVAIAYGSQKPDYQNIANALAITTYRYGEEHTPNYPLSPGTQKCNAIFAAKGQPPVYQQPIGQGGIACDLGWLLQAAIDHAPALLRRDVASGLQAAGSVDFSYPYGPNNFTAPKTTTAGQYWRVDQFLPSCSCYQVVDPTFHPGVG